MAKTEAALMYLGWLRYRSQRSYDSGEQHGLAQRIAS
jgi:hypothetical protein